MRLDDFPRVPLLFGPSPIHPLRRLSAALGGQVEIWAKREDCNSGIAFGGNKVRKLEYLVAEALDQGCDTLVSIGGVQSNHTRAVTGVACHLGLRAVTVQEHWVEWDDPNYERVGNIQLTRIMGGDIRMDPAGFDIGVRDSWKAALDSVTASGGRPYPIPAGASDHPLGGLGFANWAREVAVQEAERGVFFDHIVVCTVTGSTHAGMVAGFALEGRDDRRIVGIDASKTIEQTRAQVTSIANDTADRIGLGRELRDDEIDLVDGYAGPVYGIPMTRRSRRSTSPPEPRECSPTRCTRASRWPASSAWSDRVRSPPARGCSTPTSAANLRSPPTPPPLASADPRRVTGRAWHFPSRDGGDGPRRRVGRCSDGDAGSWPHA